MAVEVGFLDVVPKVCRASAIFADFDLFQSLGFWRSSHLLLPKLPVVDQAFLLGPSQGPHHLRHHLPPWVAAMEDPAKARQTCGKLEDLTGISHTLSASQADCLVQKCQDGWV